MENLKAMVGITSGGLCKCTPLVRCFVLCAGCKTILSDTECSTLMFEMFEMLKTLNVLSSLPLFSSLNRAVDRSNLCYAEQASIVP
jgi:hypothetical protein